MPSSIVKAISASGLSIYDLLGNRLDLYLDNATLETVLGRALNGLDLNYPIRTRSKVLKSAVCTALGYPIPTSFRKCQPRFLGQNFDTYVQKSNNLQIWNEEVSASRRYVLIRVDDNQIVTRVRVVTGDVIAKYDKTGTLTHKYQARSREPVIVSSLVSETDTPNVVAKAFSNSPSLWPDLLPIQELYRKLVPLAGTTLVNPGIDQERNRGWALHEAVCRQLGQCSWSDSGQFPDVPHQLLEVKLQTAPTIDLGLVCPDSTDIIADSPAFRHCDVRYAVFYGAIEADRVRIDHLVLTTGADFFTPFRRFEGKVKNAKIQIPLPHNFFD